jgi:hypothetical protein
MCEYSHEASPGRCNLAADPALDIYIDLASLVLACGPPQKAACLRQWRVDF